MTQITYTAFLRYLEAYGTAVHCELYANNYTRYHEGGDAEDCYFYDRGCAVKIDDFEYEGKYWFWRAVHQVSPDAEIEAVAAEQLLDVEAQKAAYPSHTVNVIAFTVTNGDLTPAQNAHYGWRNFTRMGYPVTPDPAARVLNEADLPAIKAACAPSLIDGGDTSWGKQLANDFNSHECDRHPGETVWGIFAGDTLVGIATVSYEPGIDLAWLRDVFVLPAYRGKGFGKRLVLSALAAYPDKKWHYQAARDNAPSIALARSLGFTLEGAGLFM